MTSTMFGLGMFLFLGACSSDDTADSPATVSMNKGLVFKVETTDWNEDVEASNTRAAALPAKQDLIDLGDGLIAEVSVERDAETKSTGSAKSRAIINGQYTMLAYQGGTFKGEVTGFVSGGVFTPTSANKDIALDPGVYDFVLYDPSLFSRSGNILTPTSIMEKTMLGRTTYTVTPTPKKQTVIFQMKHVTSRIRAKISTLQDIKAGNMPYYISASATNATKVTAATYDAANGSWTSISSTTGSIGLIGMNSSGGDTPISVDNSFDHSMMATSYSYVLPNSTFSTGSLSVNTAMIYNMQLYGKTYTFNLTTPITTAANESYVINIKLKPNFIYLMSDGSTGMFTETTYGGGTKHPIAIVVSQSKRLAAALKDVGDHAFGTNDNSTLPTASTYTGGFSSIPGDNGDKWTWDPAGTAGGATVKANDATGSPAFYAAAHYTPTLPTGVTLSGGAANRWFLPSLSEARMFIQAVGRRGAFQGFEHVAGVWYIRPQASLPGDNRESLINYASQQVGGGYNLGSNNMLTSTMWNTWDFLYPAGKASVLDIVGSHDLQDYGYVIPFIHY